MAEINDRFLQISIEIEIEKLSKLKEFLNSEQNRLPEAIMGTCMPAGKMANILREVSALYTCQVTIVIATRTQDSQIQHPLVTMRRIRPLFDILDIFPEE